MAAVVVTLDFRDRNYGMFSHMAAERIEAFARQHQPEVNPSQFANETIARLWKGDPDVLLVGVVEPEEAKLVGHVLALKIPPVTAYIPQVRADDNVGDALERAMDRAEAWARAIGCKSTLLATHKEPKRWKHRGYQFYRHVLLLDLAKPPAKIELANGSEITVVEDGGGPFRGPEPAEVLAE